MANRTYRVTSTITISVSTVVTAGSKTEALRVAAARPMITLCHQCASGNDSQEWVTSGELDGEPRGLVAEEQQ